MMAGSELEPITPVDAIDWDLEHRRDELRTATRRTHRSALNIFHGWTEKADLADLDDLGGRDLRGFREFFTSGEAAA